MQTGTLSTAQIIEFPAAKAVQDDYPCFSAGIAFVPFLSAVSYFNFWAERSTETLKLAQAWQNAMLGHYMFAFSAMFSPYAKACGKIITLENLAEISGISNLSGFLEQEGNILLTRNLPQDGQMKEVPSLNDFFEIRLNVTQAHEVFSIYQGLRNGDGVEFFFQNCQDGFWLNRIARKTPSGIDVDISQEIFADEKNQAITDFLSRIVSEMNKAMRQRADWNKVHIPSRELSGKHLSLV